MKMSRIVEVALNGDAPQVDPAVRRTLYSMANGYDEDVTEFRDEIRGVRRLLVGLLGTVVSGILLIIADILIKL